MTVPVYEATLAVVMERLGMSPALDVQTLKRVHLTPVVPEAADALYVVGGSDAPTEAEDRGCVQRRRAEFDAVLYLRDDDPVTKAANLKQAVLARLDPNDELLPAYPNGVVLRCGAIRPDTEIADGDATRIVMEFSFVYNAAPWSLQAAG